MADGVVPSKKVYARIGRSVKHFEQTYINPGLRGEKVVRARRGSGGCVSRNEIWILTILGTPTGGTLDMGLSIFETTETMQFNFDDTSSEVDTELDTHTEIDNGDVTVTGGPFPDAAIIIEFTGNLQNTRIPAPTINFAALTGGSGVGVILSRYQPGHPTDGSSAS